MGIRIEQLDRTSVNNSLVLKDGSNAVDDLMIGTRLGDTGLNSFIQGLDNTATGIGSYAQGAYNIASGAYSHTEGWGTVAGSTGDAITNSDNTAGNFSHAEGNGSKASGINSHAENYATIASGISSHAEGGNTTAGSNYSHAEGKYSIACNGVFYTITDYDNVAKNIFLDKVTGLIVGDLLQIGSYSSNILIDAPIIAINGLIVTLNTTATLDCQYAIKKSVEAYPTHAEGNYTIANGNGSHAEGNSTLASGGASHAEGNSTLASGGASHAEGGNTTANGGFSHAEGGYTLASGSTSHAEGSSTIASGITSHAEGKNTIASGNSSHASGYSTVAQGYAQTAIGRYNILQGTSGSIVDTDQAFIIGNGSNASTRSNALTLDWLGNLNVAGDIQDGFGNKLSTHVADYVRNPAYAITTGSANTYAISTTPAPTAYIDGMSAYININITNTGASTINWNGLGAKSIVTSKGALTAGKMTANTIVGIRYNASTGNFQLLGEGGEYGTAGAAQVLATHTIGLESGVVPGTIPSKGAATYTPSQAAQIIAANQYLSGAQTISAVTVDATKVLTGTTIAGKAGTMPNLAGDSAALALSISGTTLKLRPPKGYKDGGHDDTVSHTDANRIAANIKKGVVLDGLIGTLVPLTTEKKCAIISQLATDHFHLTVTTLTFKPRIVIAWVNGQPTTFFRFSSDGSVPNIILSGGNNDTAETTIVYNNNGFAITSTKIAFAAYAISLPYQIIAIE